MHCTHRVSRKRLWGLLLALVFGGVAAWPARAQDPATGPNGGMSVPIEGTHVHQMSTKKRIARVNNEKPAVARVTADPSDATRISITGLQPGVTTLTMTDEDGKEEKVEVAVLVDLDYLKRLLEQTVPDAKIKVIPGGNGSVVLTGWLSRADEAAAALDAARSVVGDRVINGLRVGGVQQVQLDVVVAQVSRSKFRRMSFTFLEGGQKHFVASSLGLAPAVSSTAGVGVAGSAAQLIGTPGNLFLGIINNKQSFFGFLQALKDESLLKLMAEPKLVTLTGRPASFLSGGEQAIPVPAGLGQVGVQFEEFGTRLNFLPIVLGNGKIHLEVEPEVSNLNAAFGTTIQGTIVPGRTTQRVHTTVELEAGQTYVIGGLIQHNVNASSTKIPMLGDLPFLGSAFSSKTFTEDESELLVIVTPYLVDAMTCDQLPKCLPGQETRSPDDFELFLEGILEAPRGSRAVFPGKRYLPAYKNGPSAELYPCAENLPKEGRGRCCEQGHCPAPAADSCRGAAAPATPPPVGQPLPGAPLPKTAAPEAKGPAASAPVTPPVMPPAAPGKADELTPIGGPAMSLPGPDAAGAPKPLVLPPPGK